jgi:hypothetical protein
VVPAERVRAEADLVCLPTGSMPSLWILSNYPDSISGKRCCGSCKDPGRPTVYFVFKPSRIYLCYICTYESFLFSCCLLYTLRLPYSLNLTLPIGWSIWSEMSNPTRHRAIRLYKELYRLGRDYPDPSLVAILSRSDLNEAV